MSTRNMPWNAAAPAAPQQPQQPAAPYPAAPAPAQPVYPQYAQQPTAYPAQPGYPAAAPAYPVQPGQQPYAHPAHGHPQAYAPAPGYGAQPVQPAYPAQPGYQQPAYPAQPNYQGQPGYGAQPAYPAQPGYGAQPVQPGYGQQGYAQPGYAQPAPGYGQPQYPAAPAAYAPAQPVAAPVPVPTPVVPRPVTPVVVRPVAVAAPAAPAPTPVSVAPAVSAGPAPVARSTPISTERDGHVVARSTPISAERDGHVVARSTPISTERDGHAPAVITRPKVVPQPAAAPKPVAGGAAVVGAAGVGSVRPVVVTPPTNIVTRGEEDPEDEKAMEEKIVKAAPPWVVSLVVHAVLIIVLALMYIADKVKETVLLDAVWAEQIGVQLVDDTLTTGLMEQTDVTDPAMSKDSLPADDPFAAPPQMEVTFDGTSSTDNIVAPSIGLALSGREKGMKSALLGKYGGTATTEASVRLGLEWLKRNQEPNGRWSLTGPYPSGAGIENRCAATAMALLAFQGAGHTHKEGDFKKEVAKGWQALLAMQDKDGVFYHEDVHHQALYAQAQATIAICELYGMTKDKDFKGPAQRAVDYAVKIQAPEGGWRYTPGSDSDTSVTGWYVIALQSAMMAGLEVPSPTLEKISKFLDSVGSDNMTRYSYRPGSGSTETMTAEALLCRQYLSWKHEDPRLKEGIQLILDNPIRWDFDNCNVYYWYYATQVTHHMEGDAWKKWNDVMREVIPKNQIRTGKEAGSWPTDMDRWGNHGGRLYQTCLCIYMLEVYYRHLPIYKWKQQ